MFLFKKWTNEQSSKSVIFTRKFDLSMAIKKPQDFVRILSYNFHLLSMPRDRRSFLGLKHAVDRDKSVTFPYVY